MPIQLWQVYCQPTPRQQIADSSASPALFANLVVGKHVACIGDDDLPAERGRHTIIVTIHQTAGRPQKLTVHKLITAHLPCLCEWAICFDIAGDTRPVPFLSVISVLSMTT